MVTPDPISLFTAKHATYVRFIRLVLYPQGIRAFFRQTPLLRSHLRVLDAGCGTGVVMLALHDALVRRQLRPDALQAFDLTPAMLKRFRQTIEKSRTWPIETKRADVLDLDMLPAHWRDYDLIVSASMLEYVPRERFADALAGLRLRLAENGCLILFITRRNWLTGPMIGRWWQSNLYDKNEVLESFRAAGFSSVKRSHFPLAARYLALWGHVIEAWK